VEERPRQLTTVMPPVSPLAGEWAHPRVSTPPSSGFMTVPS
jgi:hypothetical protein